MQILLCQACIKNEYITQFIPKFSGSLIRLIVLNFKARVLMVLF